MKISDKNTKSTDTDRGAMTVLDQQTAIAIMPTKREFTAPACTAPGLKQVAYIIALACTILA